MPRPAYLLQLEGTEEVKVGNSSLIPIGEEGGIGKEGEKATIRGKCCGLNRESNLVSIDVGKKVTGKLQGESADNQLALAGKPPAPKPLPENIVKAWKEAGATVGWMRVRPVGFLEFVPEDAGKPGDLPAFYFSERRGTEREIEETLPPSLGKRDAWRSCPPRNRRSGCHFPAPR